MEHAGGFRYINKTLTWIVWFFYCEWDIGHHARWSDHQGVAIGRRAHECPFGHYSRATGLVIHQNRLSKIGTQLFSKQTCDSIGNTARWRWDYQSNGLIRPLLRLCW